MEYKLQHVSKKVQSLTKCSFKNCHKKQFSPEQMNGDSRYRQKWNGTALTYQRKKVI